MFNKHDVTRDACQLFGGQARRVHVENAGCEYGEYEPRPK